MTYLPPGVARAENLGGWVGHALYDGLRSNGDDAMTYLPPGVARAENLGGQFVIRFMPDQG